jgi:hypothetical protein
MVVDSDEELARQLEANISPVHPSIRRMPDSDMQTPIDADDDETTGFDTHGNGDIYSQSPVVGSSSSPFQTPVRNGTGMTCPNCGTETGPYAGVCWGCSLTLTQQRTQAQSQWGNPFTAPAPNNFAAQQASPTEMKQWRAPDTVSQIAGLDQYHQGRTRELMLQHQQQQQQWLSQQQQINGPSSNFSGFGTSSNPIALDDDSVPVLQNYTQVPTYGIPHAPLVNNPFLNNGWSAQQNPFTQSPSVKIEPPQYLNRVPAYDYPVPNPSQDDIKELLANIRPDEDIKVEDTDAIIPGLASHMRLMKHQQVLPWCMILTVDGPSMDAKDGRK